MKKEKTKIKLKWSSPTAWILVICFAVSFTSLIVYLIEIDFSDETLFFLLSVMRYSSFMVFICSIYKLLLNFYRIIFRKQPFIYQKIIAYILFLIYGLGIFLMEAFIVVISRGNG
ncbi:MAG: hypothetical protein FWD28_03865 [Treponema sp.]|nr:hypothetical protein [Treponema sp.]